MLDKQIQTFGKCANPSTAGQFSGAEADRTASEAKETLNQLKKVAEQEPTRDAFGPPLRDALSGSNKMELDAKLARVQLAQDDPARQQRAGEARDALSKVSKAFGESEPKTMQMAQKSDSLKPGEQESFNQGMSELESLLKQLEEKRKMSSDSQAKQGREALGNLQNGMSGLYGKNERAAQLLAQLDRMLKGERPLEAEDLKELINELQHFSVETADQMSKREDKPEVTNIDPTRLPPAYRGRIQKYFQRLSEK
jgi:cytochrome c556